MLRIHAAVAPADILRVDRSNPFFMQGRQDFGRLFEGSGRHLTAYRKNPQQGGFLVHAADQFHIQRDFRRFNLLLRQQAVLLIPFPHRPAHAAQGSILIFQKSVPYRQPPGIHIRLDHRHVGAGRSVGKTGIDESGFRYLEGSINR